MMIDFDKRLVDLLSYVTADFGCSSFVTFTFTLFIFKCLFRCIHRPFKLAFRHLNRTDTARLCGLSSDCGLNFVLSAGQSPLHLRRKPHWFSVSHGSHYTLHLKRNKTNSRNKEEEQKLCHAVLVSLIFGC